ncbi:hypothetical protein EDD85DRAFT_937638 [Armillaria nabsnona]|nr:hypothetical protein EDD85DRAFT_937638 [Armillaria nabsnona]
MPKRCTWIFIGIGVIAGIALTPVIVPPILGIFGFGAAGPVVAAIQSGISNVATGNLFAMWQSIAMGGVIPWGVYAVSGIIGGITGWDLSQFSDSKRATSVLNRVHCNPVSTKMLLSVLPRLKFPKTKLQPSFVRSHFPRHLCTRTELEGELCDLEDGLQTLLDLVRHPKAATFLRAVKNYNSEEHHECSDEDRIFAVEFLWICRSRGARLALVFSLFHNHVQITSNKPIPKSYGVPDPLPLGETDSYQVKMHDRIKLVIIEQEDLRRPDPEVYTGLFTELYAASLSNKSAVYHFRSRESMDLRVHGLLADSERMFVGRDVDQTFRLWKTHQAAGVSTYKGPIQIPEKLEGGDHNLQNRDLDI